MLKFRKIISILVTVVMVVSLMAGFQVTAFAETRDEAVWNIGDYAGKDGLNEWNGNTFYDLTIQRLIDAGVVNTNPSNIHAYSHAIADVARNQADATAKIQLIIDKVNFDEAMKVISTYTAGPDLTAAQLTAVGVTGVSSSPTILTAYSTRLKVLTTPEKNTTALIQGVITAINNLYVPGAVSRIKAYILTSANALTLFNDLQEASVSGVMNTVTAKALVLGVPTNSVYDYVAAYKVAIDALAEDITLLDTVAKIQALVTSVNNTVSANIVSDSIEVIKYYAGNDNASGLDIQTLTNAGVTGTVLAYLGAHNADITKSTGYMAVIEKATSSQVDTTAKIQALLSAYTTAEDARIAALNAALPSFKVYAENDDASLLTIAQLVGAGITGAIAENLGTHNLDMTKSTGYMQKIEMETPVTISLAKIQTIVDAVNLTESSTALTAINALVLADNADTLTISVLTKAGVALTNAANLDAYKGALVNLANATVLNAVTAQALITATDAAIVAIEGYTSLTVSGLTIAQLVASGLKIADVVPQNLDAYKVAIGAAAVGGADSLVEIQNIVWTVNNAANLAANLAIIDGYNPITVSALTILILKNVGVTGTIDRFLPQYQIAIGSAAVGAANSTSKIQTLINTVNVVDTMIETISVYAANDNASLLTIADLKLIGVDPTTIVDGFLAAYQKKIADATAVNANSLVKIQALVDAVKAEQAVAAIAKIEAYTAATVGSLTIAELSAAGVTALSLVTSNLDSYKVAIGDAAVGAADTTVEIQAIIDSVNASVEVATLATIKGYAANDDASLLTIDQLLKAGINANAYNLAAYKVAISAATGSDLDTKLKIQACITAVDAAQAILAIARIKGYATADNASALTIADLSIAGVTALTLIDANLSEYKLAVAGSVDTSVDEILEIQALVTLVNSQQNAIVAVNVIKAYAGNAAAMTIAQLTAAGVVSAIEANLDAYKVAVAATAASALDTTVKIQAVITAVNLKIATLPVISAYNINRTAASLTIAQLLAVGALNVYDYNLSLYISELNKAPIGAADSTAKIQVIVDQANAIAVLNFIEQIKAYAGDNHVSGQNAALQLLLDKIGITGVLPINIGAHEDGTVHPKVLASGYIKAIEDAIASDVDTKAKIQALIDAVNVAKASALVTGVTVGAVSTPLPLGSTDSTTPSVILVKIDTTVKTVLPTNIAASTGAVLTLYTNADFVTGAVSATGTTLNDSITTLYAKVVSENGTVIKYFKLVYQVEDATAAYTLAVTKEFATDGAGFKATISIDRGNAVSLDDAMLLAVYTLLDGSKTTQVLEIGSLTTKDITVGAGFLKVELVLVNGTDLATTAYKSNTVTIALPVVAVTGVTISSATAALMVNAATQLTATVSPVGATDKTVTWTSSNANVATVSATGLVTAVGAGTATITVTTTSGAFTATCVVTVSKPVVVVTKVTLNKTSLTLAKGKTFKAVATVTPATASNKKVTFKSSNTKIATVSATGVIKAIAKGTTYIVVYAANGVKTTCKVVVK